MFDKIKQKVSNKIPLSPTKRKVVKNVYWSFLGRIISMLAQLFVGIIVARYLGPEQYGLMNYVISYVAIFEVISEFGLSNIEIRELSSHENLKEQILGSAFITRVLFSFIAYLILAASLMLYNPDRFTSIMILLYGLYMFTKPFAVIRNYFTSIIFNEYVVKTEITRTLLGAAIKIVLLLLKEPLAWFIMAVAFDGVIVASGYVYSYNKKVGRLKDWTFDKNEAKYLAIQGFPLLLSSAAIVVYGKIDQVFIGNILNNTEVGYYSTADKFLTLILYLPGVLCQTVAPLLVKKYQNDYNGYLKMRQQFVNIVVWSTVILSFFVSLSSYFLITLTFGSAFLASVPVLQVLSWKTVGSALSEASGQLIILEKKQKWAAIRNLVGCVVNVGLNLILIPKYGIMGSAWTAILTVLCSGTLANLFIPSYRQIFMVQMKSIAFGWKDIINIKLLLQ